MVVYEVDSFLATVLAEAGHNFLSQMSDGSLFAALLVAFSAPRNFFPLRFATIWHMLGNPCARSRFSPGAVSFIIHCERSHRFKKVRSQKNCCGSEESRIRRTIKT